MRALAAPLTLSRQQDEFLQIVADRKPDIVHALRVPYEGMLASITPQEIPFIVSIWGNDLTLHAHTSPMMAAQTRRTLRRADGLLADADRDLRLAGEWGLAEDATRMVLPGNGGLDLEEVNRILKPAHPIINPVSGRQDTGGQPARIPSGQRASGCLFPQSPQRSGGISRCLICLYKPCRDSGRRKSGLSAMACRIMSLLLPYLPQPELWQIFSRSKVYVSLSSHDGTPNTLLEALACGCFPVVGDVESLREWLDDGRNGLLVDPRDAQAASAAVIRALRHSELRQHARQHNIILLKERAEISKVREQAQAFYSRFFP